MSALQEYLATMRRQAEILDWAAAIDDVTCDCDSRPHSRRTQQDRNRFEYECALLDDEDGELPLLANVLNRRMRTRVGFLVGRYRLKLAPLHGAALNEARQLGIYSDIARLLVDMKRAHETLLLAYKNDSDQPVDFQDALQRHRETADALAEYIPVSPTGCLMADSPAAVDSLRPEELPTFRIEVSGAEISFQGKTYVNLDVDAAEALQKVVAAYPRPYGLTKDYPQPKRVIAKLPRALRERLESSNAGYFFVPPKVSGA